MQVNPGNQTPLQRHPVVLLVVAVHLLMWRRVGVDPSPVRVGIQDEPPAGLRSGRPSRHFTLPALPFLGLHFPEAHERAVSAHLM